MLVPIIFCGVLVLLGGAYLWFRRKVREIEEELG
jgi:nitrate reductase gamma subunit